MPDIPVMQDLLDKLTLVAVLSWGVLAFVRGWIVPGSVHEALRMSEKNWVERHDRIASIAEAALREAALRGKR